MENKQSKHIIIHVILVILILMSIANAIDKHMFWKHFESENYPLHSTMEAMGALAALIMGFMSIRFLIGIRDKRYEIISLGLLAMGMWDLFHAFLHTGEGFVLTLNISLLLGGFFFFLSIFNWSKDMVNNNIFWKITSLAFFFVLAMLLVALRDKLPPMVTHTGLAHQMQHGQHFTPLANMMNITAGVFFLIAAIKIYGDYRKFRQVGLLLLVILAVQSASAGFLFPYSYTWADSWWFWHLLRFLAFLGILVFMISQFSRILNERTRMLKNMQETENKFQKLFNSEPDALFIAEAQTGIIIDVNEAALELMKKKREELLGINQIELHPPDKREEIAELFKDIALKGSREPQQVVVQDSQDNIIPVEVVGNVIEIEDKPIAIGIFRDISARKSLEKQKAKLDKKFRLFIEKVPLPLCILNQKTGDFSFYNNSFHNLFGYTKKELPNVSDWWQKAYPDEKYRQWVIENWNRAVARAEKENTEITSDKYNVTCKDGSIRNIIIGGVVIDNELLATFVDITDITQAEEIMKQQQEQLTSMFNGFEDLIYVADPDTYELLYVNDAFYEIFGRPDKDKKCYEILQNRNSPCPFCTNDIIIKQSPGKAYIWEFQNEITKNWYRCFDKAIRWSNSKLVRFEMAIDITAMKKTQQEIIDKNQIIESTIDSLPGIFYQINQEGNYESWNSRFKEVTGYNDEEMAEIHALEFFTESERPLVSEAIQNVFKEGEAQVEADLVLKSGEKIPYMFNGRMFVIKGNRYLIGMGMDISRLKKVEKNLRKSNKELEAFNRIAVGREKRMIELKKQINTLSVELQREEPFDLSFVEEDSADEEI